MISFQNALQLVLGQASSFGVEKIPTAESLHRVLAENIYADRDYPPFNRVAMDGYAVKFADLQAGIRSFEIREVIFPAQVYSVTAGTGECFKIMTGAALPPSVDTIIRTEDGLVSGNTVTLNISGYQQGQNISNRAQDAAAGSIVLSKSTRITATVIALLTAIGKMDVTVERRPTVSIITTGNEVVDPYLPVNPVQIRNSNQYQLRALLQSVNVIDVRSAHAMDDLAVLKEQFSNAWDADIIISCGAVSAGDADHIPAVLNELGVEKLFHKTAIKPGKPIWVGRRANGKLVFSLPGNPLSCLACFLLFIRPFLNACYGLHDTQAVKFVLEDAVAKASALDEFFPGRIEPGTDRVQRLKFNGSGDIRAAVEADGLVHHPADIQQLPAGATVTFYPI